MSSTKQIRYMMALAALALCAAGTAHAQSPLRAIARAFSPGKEAAPQQPEKPKAAALANDPSLGVSHGYKGVTVNTEMAAAQTRNALSAFAEKLPSFGGRKSRVDLGSELEESTSTLAVNLFHDPEIRKLLGDNPRFIYDPAGKSDPMVVPWVRRAAIFKELMTRADEQIAGGKLDDALETYRKIMEMRDERFTAAVQLKLTDIAKLQQVDATKLASTQAAQVAAEKVELPQWIQENTTGVLFERDKGTRSGLCLVGEYMLRAGEALPNYPEITVAAIGEKSVTYSFRGHDFNVQLNSDPLNVTPAVKVKELTRNSATVSYQNHDFKVQMIK